MDPQTQNLIHREFSHLKDPYFDTATFGPSPFQAKKAVEKALDGELDPFLVPPDWMEIPTRLRQSIATLLNCSPEHIAHLPSTVDLISLVANGHPWRPGDTVCALKGDYPSNVLPWMSFAPHHSFEFELLSLPSLTLEHLKKALPSSCRVLTVSWVAFDTGQRLDLASLGQFCKERDIFFIVDATQGFGGMAIPQEDLSLIDVLACSTYKWLLGPYGGAFGYFSSRAIEKIRRQNASWLVSPTLETLDDLLRYTPKAPKGAKRFDRGQSPNMLASAGLQVSLDLLNTIGLETIEDDNASLCSYFLENLPKSFKVTTPQERGNIICLQPPCDLSLLKEMFEKEKVKVSIREGNLRVSFHFFNTRKQVDRLLEILDRISKK